MVRVPEQRYLVQTWREDMLSLQLAFARTLTASGTENGSQSAISLCRRRDGEGRGRRSLEQDAYQERECGKQSTRFEESQEGRKKGQSRRELSERSDVGRPECSGGSEHFWIK
jgi:hypothetical protein